jgi:hypothetical protein
MEATFSGDINSNSFTTSLLKGLMLFIEGVLVVLLIIIFLWFTDFKFYSKRSLKDGR